MHSPTVRPNTARVGNEHLLVPFLVVEVTHLLELGLFLSPKEQKILVDVVKLRIRVEMSRLLQFLIRNY